jgi:hypothetical protein
MSSLTPDLLARIAQRARDARRRYMMAAEATIVRAIHGPVLRCPLSTHCQVCSDLFETLRAMNSKLIATQCDLIGKPCSRLEGRP